jgi:profilin
MSILKLTDSLVGKVTGGAVIGLDGGIWATTPGFYGNPAETAVIAQAFAPKSSAPYQGLALQKDLYVITTMTPDLIIAQRANHDLFVARCPRCFVIAFRDEQMNFAQARDAVLSLAETLRAPEFEAQFQG